MRSSLFKLVSKHMQNTVKRFSTSEQKNVKVTIVGASGGIGQPLALLLKQCPMIKQLNLHDIAETVSGVAKDVSHIETKSLVCEYIGPKQLGNAVNNVDIIVVPAGMPRKPGMKRDDLFAKNASIIRNIADVCAKANPSAIFLVITNPVNSMLPIAAEVYKKNDVFNPCRMFGVTTLDICRANRFLAEMKNLNPMQVNVPVICGHSGITILPVISKSEPQISLSVDEQKNLIKRIQEAGTEVVKAKAGTGSATLAMAYAGARFTVNLIKAMNGDRNIVECTMVQSNICPAVEYFASPIKLGVNGLEQNFGIPKLNSFEQELLEKALPELKKNIQRGIDFVQQYE